MPRKPEINVNLVFDDGAYRVVDTVQLTKLMKDKSVVFEQVRQEKNVYGHFYRKVT